MSSRIRAPRFTKDEILAGIFFGAVPLAALVVPSLVTHGISSRQWVTVPLLLIFMVGGQIWAHRHEDRRIYADLAEWRRVRPHPQPKAR